MTDNLHRLQRFLESLDKEDRQWLLQELLSEHWINASSKESEDALAVERWLFNRVNMADTPARRDSRSKIGIIFLLIRYCGLRLSEIFALGEKDIDWQNSFINIHGKRKRSIPVPLPVMQRMRQTWRGCNWHVVEQNHFYCDPSQLRRIFNQCAIETGLDATWLGVRNLRSLRAKELEKAGGHSSLISYFLDGENNCASPFSNPAQMLEGIVQKKHVQKNRTSARNTFEGKITALQNRGILVDVALETVEGLLVRAIITQTSCKNLNLRIGKMAAAIVKAPWITVQPFSEQPDAAKNFCPGHVESIKSDANAQEILITVPSGPNLCAIYARGRRLPESIEIGSEVWACFDPFSVIISI